MRYHLVRGAADLVCAFFYFRRDLGRLGETWEDLGRVEEGR